MIFIEFSTSCMNNNKLTNIKIDEKLLKEVVKRIVNATNPIKIILFGSYAYGRPHKGSDLDILVIADNSIPSRYEVSVKVYSALRGIHTPKDVVVAVPNQIEDWKKVPQAFITTIVNKGRLLYERKN